MTQGQGDGADQKLRERLRALRVDLPDDGFSASLHRKLVAAGPPDAAPWWRRLWPAGGERVLWPALVAACLAVGIFATFSSRSPSVAPQQTATTELPATKVAVVRLNLSAEVAVQSAQIRVSLPDGLVFWADGQELPQRSFEWSQPLNAGDNDIPIAVRGLHPGHYRMTVTANIGKQRVEDDVLLEVTDG